MFIFTLPSLAAAAGSEPPLTETVSYLKQLQRSASQQALHRDPTWHHLLHLRSTPWGAEGVRSEVLSDEFFLSAVGRSQPEAELMATLQGLAEPATPNADHHPQCRFPARDRWLRRRLGIDPALLPQQPCPSFQAWSLNGQTESVSLVLATGYLSNPASFFGHLLLKLNGQEETQVSNLLDTSVNYGALVPDGVDPVSYIVNGVTGGYDGGFSHIEYYVHHHNYAELEQRDVWEYRLRLNEQQLSLVTAHAWELLGKRFTYYFFKENCAYQMAALLNLVTETDLVPARPWIVPQSVIHALAEAEQEGRPLIQEIRYHPSRQTRFDRRYRALDSEGRGLYRSALRNPETFASDRFVQAPVQRQVAVVDAVIDDVQRRGATKGAQRTTLGHAYDRALALRFRLPSERADVEPAPDSPHLGRPPGLLTVGLAGHAHRGAAVAAQVRPAYYDPLDAGPGHVAGGALVMADLAFNVHEEGVFLRHFDMIRAESVGQASASWALRDRLAWRLKLGIEPQSLSCHHCLVLRGSASRGYSLPLGENVISGLLLGGALHSARNGEGIASGELIGFVQLDGGRSWRSSMEWAYRQSLDGEIADRQRTTAEVQLFLGQRWAVRSRFEWAGVGQAIVSLGHYW